MTGFHYGYGYPPQATSARWEWLPRYPLRKTTHPLEILLLTTEVPPYFRGGLGRHVDRLARYLMSRGHLVHVLSPYPADDRLPYPVSSLDLFIGSLPLNQGHQTVVHVHDIGLWPQGNILATALHSPLLTTWHTLYASWAQHVSLIPEAQTIAFERMVLEAGGYHIWVSQFLLSEAQDFYQYHSSSAHDWVIGSGISFPHVDFSAEVKGFPDLLYFGRLELEKGVDWIFHALSGLISRNRHFQAVLCGTGSMQEQIRSLIHMKGWTNNVYAPGLIGDSELARYLSTASLGVLPSRFEPFGLTALESMASGVATIVGPAAGYREFATPGLNCLQATDPTTLMDKVQYLLSHPDRCRELGHRGAQLSSEWNWTQIGQKIEDVYHRILATGDFVATREDKL